MHDQYIVGSSSPKWQKPTDDGGNIFGDMTHFYSQLDGTTKYRNQYVGSR